MKTKKIYPKDFQKFFNPVKYRNFSSLTLLTISGLASCQSTTKLPAAQTVQHPNIVLIITDQQYVNKMSYMGDPYLNTPTMDRIAKNGYAFAQSYCTYPLSIPQRFSLFTGFYPAEYNARFNPTKNSKETFDYKAIEAEQPRMLANLFRKGGYDVFYGGKAHLTSPKTNEDAEYYGFNNIYSVERRAELGRDAANFISKKTSGDKPFLMVVSYINPHDICEYDDYIDLDNLTPQVLKNKAEGIKRVKNYVETVQKTYSPEQFYGADICPPLPENFPPMFNEPPSLPLNTGFNYTIEQRRMYRWVYNRLVEEVDSNIAPVIDALDKGGFLKNTIIVFTSDHGEMDESHGAVHKMAPFKEAQNVPFIFWGPGIVESKVDRSNMVNTGIDLLPTLCDLAGIQTDGRYPGLSVKPLITGKSANLGRRYIFCEGPNWFQVVKDGRYKYTVLEYPGHPAMLVDLQNDPGEMINQTVNPAYDKIREELSQILAQELAKRGIKLNTHSKI